MLGSCAFARNLFFLLVVLFLVSPAFAQSPVTFQYFYDAGQLSKVVDGALACWLRYR